MLALALLLASSASLLVAPAEAANVTVADGYQSYMNTWQQDVSI